MNVIRTTNCRKQTGRGVMNECEMLVGRAKRMKLRIWESRTEMGMAFKMEINRNRTWECEGSYWLMTATSSGRSSTLQRTSGLQRWRVWLDQLNAEKPGGSSTLLTATYAIVALRTRRDNLDRCAAHVSWTRSVVQYHLCSFPAPSGSLHSVLPPVGYRTQVRCGGQIKSRGSHVR